MWYCFTVNGQMEIIMLTLKQIKAGRVKEIVLGKHPEATDIREATDAEVSAVIQRVRDEERAKHQINERHSCFSRTPQEMTLQQIQSRLDEIDIDFRSYEGDEEYDLSDLQQEKGELEKAIANGDYADFNEWE
jgi:hypothetical protein